MNDTFNDFLGVLKAKDTFRTYGFCFEEGIDQAGRIFLCQKKITEKRTLRGVSDEVPPNKGRFFVVGAFLKMLCELGFEVIETTEEETDFRGTLNHDLYTIDVDFNYDEVGLEYHVKIMNETNTPTAAEAFLDYLLNPSNRLGFSGVVRHTHLYDDLDTFMRDFRGEWDKYQKTLCNSQ